MQLLRTLMARCTPKKFDLAKYQDRYTAKLTQLIEAKVAGQEIVAAPASAPVPVIHLVEALQRSLAETASATNGATPKPKAAAVQIEGGATPHEDGGIGISRKA